MSRSAFPPEKGVYTVSKTALDNPGAIRADMPAEALGDPDSGNALAITSPAVLWRAGGLREIAEAADFRSGELHDRAG
jgi:hypothetical protein